MLEWVSDHRYLAYPFGALSSYTIYIVIAQLVLHPLAQILGDRSSQVLLSSLNILQLYWWQSFLPTDREAI